MKSKIVFYLSLNLLFILIGMLMDTLWWWLVAIIMAAVSTAILYLYSQYPTSIPPDDGESM